MKLLTGKCENDFRQWLRPDITSDHRYSELITNCFYDFPVAIQWGVIQDFADSNGINITLYQMDLQAWYGYRIVAPHILKEYEYSRGVWRREEVREVAIKHFNRMYNGK